ncbi:phage holin family protein [Proteus columbae]|uniref:phage holin family protein n=1 Tax=Proteus columbae TaxID=1987580 RepID=UPI001F504DBE|nr:phage holin family protein [Proteus columbae]
MKKMPYKDPSNINGLTALLVSLMTLFGSIASYANKVLKGEPFRFGILIAQIIVSMFAGMFVLLGASYFQWQPEVAGGIAGMAGWMGSAFISALVKLFLRKVAGE